MAIALINKPIIITGAATGIGRATAIACAQAGMPVVLTGRREDRLRAAAAALPAGSRSLVVPGDVTNPDDCRRAVEECLAAFGAVYAVFANAGYGYEGPVHEMTEEQVRAIFETNFFGTLNAFRPAIPHMIERRAGHVLICSSCLARFIIPFYGAYSATKAAQHHVGRAMRLELAPHNVFVSTVHPVGTRTEFFDVVAEQSGASTLVKHSPDLFVQPASRVASAVVRCLKRPRPEVWTSQLVRLGMSIGGAIPRTADLFIKRMVDDHTRNASAAAAARLASEGTRVPPAR
ncbi:MAG: SDR family NAD(P)-dependent oxidoreductase [Phycisphaerales bacterium]|nr:SDR family NAD(P)-dependent oxidoreductase [Phycisphaerales bacterium]